MNRVLNLQMQSVDELNSVNAEATMLSDSQLYFVYKGRKFAKYRRSEYIMSFATGDSASTGTKITVAFNRELFNLPWPMTSVQELDIFMKEKLSAYRRK